MSYEPKYVVIAEIETGHLWYCGTKYTTAAKWLTPGRCFGRGDTEFTAKANAAWWAEKFRGGK